MPKLTQQERQNLAQYLKHQPKTFDGFYPAEGNGARVQFNAKVGRNRKLARYEYESTMDDASAELAEVEYITGL